jgi:hypothetical protein
MKIVFLWVVSQENSIILQLINVLRALSVSTRKEAMRRNALLAHSTPNLLEITHFCKLTSATGEPTHQVSPLLDAHIPIASVWGARPVQKVT